MICGIIKIISKKVINLEKIQFLIKFGERKYMERLAKGYLYFSCAKKLREIEEKLKCKGQGDCLEGASRMHGTDMELYDYETGMLWKRVPKVNMVVHYEPANNIPVFCLFTCYKDDCISDNEDNWHIEISDKIISDIKEHFNKADTAAIITNPTQFVDDVNKAFNNSAKVEQVHYFNVDGIVMDNGQIVQDLAYHKYLTQDVPPERVNGQTKYRFSSKYVYRCLFCKDKYFENEREYRILLPDKKIIEPQEFYVETSSPIKLYDINTILNGNTFTI